MTPKIASILRSSLRIGGVAVLAIAVVAGAYFLLNRFLQDRQRAMFYSRQADPRLQIQRQSPFKNQTRAYTKEELEKARREGKPLPGIAQQQPYVPNPVNDPGESIQRTMRTLEEINRINQMNQRLMEQQQRLQQQQQQR